MKQTLTFAIALLLSVAALAQETPQWVFQTPKSDNETYLFVHEQGVAPSQQEAYNIAMTRMFQSTANRIGQPFDSQHLAAALQNGTSLEVISSIYKIPINKVCEYSEQLADGSYRVHVLCQVAAAGNIPPQWTPFANCYGGSDERNGMALLKSVFVPGLGQIGKGYVAEGVLTLAGEVLLVGGATECYYIAQNSLGTMRDPQVTYNDFASAQQTYNTCRTTSHLLWGTAAALYAFNLIRAATAKPRYHDGLALAPTLLPTATGLAPSLSITLNLKNN